MAGKMDFTTEEWQTLGRAPALAALYIAKASPSGPIGLVKEMLAASTSILNESKDAHGLQIVKDLAADLEAKTLDVDMPKFSSADEITTYAKTELGTAVRLVESKSPGEATAYRQWLYDVANKAAESAKEGGFLGIGGTAVSDAEKSALGELATILGVSA